MNRSGVSAVFFLAVFGLVFGIGEATARKKKKKKAQAPAAPIELSLTNECDTDLDLSVGGQPVKTAAKAKSGPHLLTANGEDNIYKLELAGAKEPLARLSIPPGAHYEVTVSACRGALANVKTRLLADPPSPHAAAAIRFRARQNTYMEYKVGKKGRFKPLSVALTSYHERVAGDVEITLRLRAARRGPVLKMMKQSVNLEPGHRYLVEIGVAGRDIVYSNEDEGIITGT